MLGKICILMAALTLASAEEIVRTVKAGEQIIIEVEDKTGGTQCDFVEPFNDRRLQPTTTAKATDEDGDNLVTEGERDAGWSFELAGSGNDACGIQLNQVDIRDGEGKWFYFVSEGISGTIELTVEVVPESEDVYFFDTVNEQKITSLDIEINNPDVGKKVDVYCIIEGINPAPEDDDIELEIDGNSNLNATLNSADYVEDSGLGWAAEDYVYKAHFTYHAEEEHDGGNMTCVVQIDGEPEVVGEVMTLAITAPPCGDCASTTGEDEAELGEDWTISVSFPSNPEPISAKWYIPELGSNTLLDAMEGADIGNNARATDAITSSGRYSTSKLTRNGDSNDFSTSLTIEELEEDDENAQFTLMLENDLGKSNVTVSIRSFKDEGLSSGAIAGIVCGCVAFVVIVVIIIFFAVKKYKSKKARRSQQERIDRARVHYEQRYEYEQKEQQEGEREQQQREGGSDNLGAVFYGANVEGEVSTEC